MLKLTRARDVGQEKRARVQGLMSAVGPGSPYSFCGRWSQCTSFLEAGYSWLLTESQAMRVYYTMTAFIKENIIISATLIIKIIG